MFDRKKKGCSITQDSVSGDYHVVTKDYSIWPSCNNFTSLVLSDNGILDLF